jgi:hypothetical protein
MQLEWDKNKLGHLSTIAEKVPLNKNKTFELNVLNHLNANLVLLVACLAVILRICL